jgi:hypothetical protein
MGAVWVGPSISCWPCWWRQAEREWIACCAVWECLVTFYTDWLGAWLSAPNAAPVPDRPDRASWYAGAAAVGVVPRHSRQPTSKDYCWSCSRVQEAHTGTARS